MRRDARHLPVYAVEGRSRPNQHRQRSRVVRHARHSPSDAGRRRIASTRTANALTVAPLMTRPHPIRRYGRNCSSSLSPSPMRPTRRSATLNPSSARFSAGGGPLLQLDR